MRVRTVAALLSVVAAACGGEPRPPVVDASEVTPRASVSPTVDPDEARLAELRATDQFDEFAEHERAAKADGARLAWENFAPIVDGRRVEWTNKAALWDSIAPKIRDEALLLGPEYRKPLWNNSTAVANSADVQWTDRDTGGVGDYVEFISTIELGTGPVERVWGFLIERTAGGGRITAVMPPIDLAVNQYADMADARDHLVESVWAWIESRRFQ